MLTEHVGSGRSSGSFLDPRAVVSLDACLGVGVRVGPFAVVGPGVRLADRVVVASHAVIEGDVEVGADTQIGPFACLGQAAQDRWAQDGLGRLVIGQGVRIREFATLHVGSARDGSSVTRVGDDVMLMTHSHVAHDCYLGSGVTLASGAMLGGYVHLEEGVMIGARAMVQQHARVGKLAFVGGNAMVERDVPPYCRVAGDRARLCGLNVVGLQRAQCDGEALEALHAAYGLLFRSPRPLDEVVAGLAHRENHPYVSELLTFLRESRRGICR